MTCRHLTVFVFSHLMTCRHFWQCLCPSISWPALLTMCPSILWHADTFDNVCVHPSHHLQTHLTLWQSLCWSISWQDLQTLCVDPSHDLQTLLTMFVSIHLMTCRHFWQCLCPSISWPAHTFDNGCPSISWPADTFDKCVHPSHDLLTCLTMCSSILWHADTFDSVCVHPSYDLQTLLTLFVSSQLMTCRHFWQCLCPSILWPAHIFDSVFTSIYIMTCRHFWQWALLSLDNTTFPFSVFYTLFPGYNLMLMPLFCIPGTITKTCSPCVVPKFGDARESSRALVNQKESKKDADRRARNKLTSWGDPVWLTGH